jgi:hypothetical protein
MDNLDSKRIVETIVILCKRINERFPQSGLSSLCLELRTIAEESTSRCEWIEKPHWLLRMGIGFITILFIFILLTIVRSAVNFSAIHDIKLVDFLQLLDAGMNSIILIGAALLFVITVETRRKRQRAIKAIHQLRVLAHVIDMYQLTKDPERIIRNRTQWTSSSPRETMTAFELTRYLTYCSEMLSLVGKIAALYVQDFQDAIVLEAVNDVEALTTGLSQKIWQKILILHRLKDQSAATTTTTQSKKE